MNLIKRCASRRRHIIRNRYALEIGFDSARTTYVIRSHSLIIHSETKLFDGDLYRKYMRIVKESGYIRYRLDYLEEENEYVQVFLDEASVQKASVILLDLLAKRDILVRIPKATNEYEVSYDESTQTIRGIPIHC